MRAPLVFLAALTLFACAAGDSGGSPPSRIGDMDLPYMNRPTSGLVTAGQISKEQLIALPGFGVSRVVCLRAMAEGGTGWEEPEAEAAGITFIRLPIKGREALSRANVEALETVLERPTEGETLVYCGSSNRVGTLLGLKSHWLDGKSKEEALAFGKAAGLTHMEPVLRELLGLQ